MQIVGQKGEFEADVQLLYRHPAPSRLRRGAPNQWRPVLVREVLTVAGQPRLRMMLFHVPAGVLTKIAMVHLRVPQV